ncbi:MAG: class I adenylate-forming enzyme family protein, partial [Caulobacteraceae bacterium]|nr:class I adenylate-forming enzyme family protein [Caulobacteraceae bacterium]
MDDASTPAWPAVGLDEARRILTSPGMAFEMETVSIDGRPTRAYRNAPPNLRALLEATRQWGGRDFIVYEGERLTYDAHYRAVSALARAMVERFGLAKGDRVAIAMRNLPEWSIAFWATVSVGAVAAPLNAWGTGGDLEYGLSDSEAKVALVDAERLGRLEPGHLAKASLAGLIAVRTPREALGSALALDELIGHAAGYGGLPDGPPPEAEIGPDDEATILYTSGTTGRPKGALGTHRNILSNLVSVGYSSARAIVRRTGAPPPVEPNPPQRTALLPVPLFHVTGCHSMLVPTLASGGKLVLMHRWSPERALELIEAERVNGLTAVPAMIWQLLESRDFGRRDLSSIEGLSYGGAAAAPELTLRVKALFPAIWPGQGYGATETSSVATANSAEDYLARPDSVGLPPPVDDIMIAGPDGQALPAGEVGEICVFGPNVVKGYWRKPEATAAAFVDGWYHTGDIGRMDGDGFVYVMDRIKDMLIRGGENIYCVEIEDALFTHPAVIEAAVVGLPHRILGEEVGAVVRLKPGAAATEAELRAHVRKLLAAHKTPVRIDIRFGELPRNANGKTLKAVLRA